MGLTSDPKRLPPKLFYDAVGSALFEQITALPEYYLTRVEREILSRNADDIITAVGTPLTVIELGAGSGTKTALLLDAAVRAQGATTYVPMDVSAEALRDAEKRIAMHRPKVRVLPVHGDYAATLPEIVEVRGRKLVLFIGSSIGNYEPMAATALLASVRRCLAPGDTLLLGTDMRKSADALIAAYDDAQGVTAAFNLNVLTRINRELGGDFDEAAFAHCAVWNPAASRIEMHLESLRAQRAHIHRLGMTVDVGEGERIHTENSYKYTIGMVDSIVTNAGLSREKTWTDERAWFTVHLLRC